MEIILKPKSRDTEIVTQTTGDELLVYDLQRHRAMSLNQTAKQVFCLSDGSKSVMEIAGVLKMPEDMVLLALDQLEKNHLLEAEQPLVLFTPISRRETIRRIGISCLTAFPYVIGIAAPAAVHAASCIYTNLPCNGSGTFCSLGAHTDCCSCRCNPINPSLGRCA